MSRFLSSARFCGRLFAAACVFSLTSTIAVAPVPPVASAVEEAQQDRGGVLRGTDRLNRSHRVPLVTDSPTSPVAAEALVTRPLDIPEKDWLPGHRVVDLRAAPGADVLASMGGQVSFVGTVAGTPVVTIRHRDGLHTTYEPVHAEVTKGEFVSRGQRIGRLANAALLGDSARKPDGLSWGAWVKGTDGRKRYLDPFELLGSVRVRLLR
ncbi:peptidoglycan DD-metalloendopeptidase family protein [Corynebacterium sp. UMB9976]|uniref:M23 family metallopeptidase n=1 Tax=Corynebacterium TaxID=1716 RepID=UPI0011E87E8A|nr:MULTISPECIES: peptidoglycan DD-metalloendopeptidase family protein [Corynebacterium]MDK6301255.1 peptidoglycan DD-metalloendopeptidase family protein [Corynebacterium sp. UMB9976]TYR18108.1 M23 family metallopeptidase [Corynebacterium urealyticum]